MISVCPDTLVTGVDRWFLEKLLDSGFFWYAAPFEHSRALGFITPEKDVPLNFPTIVVVDLSETDREKVLLFDPEKTVFYSEEWRENASVAASFVKNIVNFRNGKPDFVKKDYKITPFA